MSIAYRAVGWNRQKRLYDSAIGAFLVLGLAIYAATVFLSQPATTAETFIIRFTSIAAIILLHIILVIGPLARHSAPPIIHPLDPGHDYLLFFVPLPIREELGEGLFGRR